MPDPKLHVQKAEHNERFFQQFKLADTQYADWGITALFYSALHYVDAVLGQPPDLKHPKRHKNRLDLFRNYPALATEYPHYEELFNRSIDARYNIQSFPIGFVAALERDHFEPLKLALRTHLALP